MLWQTRNEKYCTRIYAQCPTKKSSKQTTNHRNQKWFSWNENTGTTTCTIEVHTHKHTLFHAHNQRVKNLRKFKFSYAINEKEKVRTKWMASLQLHFGILFVIRCAGCLADKMNPGVQDLSDYRLYTWLFAFYAYIPYITLGWLRTTILIRRFFRRFFLSSFWQWDARFFPVLKSYSFWPNTKSSFLWSSCVVSYTCDFVYMLMRMWMWLIRKFCQTFLHIHAHNQKLSERRKKAVVLLQARFRLCNFPC